MHWETKEFVWLALLRYSFYCRWPGTKPTISSKSACNNNSSDNCLSPGSPEKRWVKSWCAKTWGRAIPRGRRMRQGRKIRKYKQWLRLPPSNAGGAALIPGQGTKIPFVLGLAIRLMGSQGVTENTPSPASSDPPCYLPKSLPICQQMQDLHCYQPSQWWLSGFLGSV